MKRFFSIILKVLGYLFLGTAIIGGGRSLLLHGPSMPLFLAIAMYLVPATLCFWGGGKLNNKKDKNDEDTQNNA